MFRDIHVKFPTKSTGVKGVQKEFIRIFSFLENCTLSRFFEGYNKRYQKICQILLLGCL